MASQTEFICGRDDMRTKGHVTEKQASIEELSITGV